MRSTFRVLAVTAAVSSLALAGTAFADGFEGHHHHHGDMLDLLHGVQLTDAQKSQVQVVFQNAHTAMHTQYQQMRAVEEQIETKLLAPGSVSQADIAPLLQQEEQLRQSADAAKLQTALQVRAILTQSQLAQAAATHAQLATLHEQERAVTHGAAPDARSE